MPFLLFLGLGATIAYLALDKQQVNELHRTTVLTHGRVFNLRLLDVAPSMQITPDQVYAAILSGLSTPNAVQFSGPPTTDANYVWTATLSVPGPNDVSFTWDTPYTVEDIGSALFQAA